MPGSRFLRRSEVHVNSPVATVSEINLVLDKRTHDVRRELVTAENHVVVQTGPKDPAETAILDETADVDVVLVVMSTHGRGGLGRFVYGSVADTVLRYAPIGVLTVPPHGLDAWPTDQQIKIDRRELVRPELMPPR